MHEYNEDVREDSVVSNGSPEQARDLAEPSQPWLQWNLRITRSLSSVQLKDFMK